MIFPAKIRGRLGYRTNFTSFSHSYFEELALGLGVWQGEYKGVQGQWLRWQAKDGQWVATDGERAEKSQQRAEKMAERLRSLGIDPEDV